MIIGNISANDLYQYNKVNTVRPEITVAKPEQSPNSINTQEDSASVKEAKVDNRKLLDTKEVADFAIDELSKEFDLLGSEVSLTKLDEEKAFSDVKKDSILQEYQYFVGNLNTEDGSVTRKKFQKVLAIMKTLLYNTTCR